VACRAGDNLPVHAAVYQAPAGWALSVSVEEDADHAYWGEVLTVAATSVALAGLVIDGGVRDIGSFSSGEFPVFATGTVLRGPSKVLGGTLGGATRVGGVLVRTGDWLVGDADGVVVVPADRVDAVLAAGEQRAAREQHVLDAVRAGATTVNLLNLDISPVTINELPAGP